MSPRELADLVGVSESSIKRWVDDGRIDVMRTAGGHRRIRVPDAIRFIRVQGLRLAQPQGLGIALPDPALAFREESLTGARLVDLLERGELGAARSALLLDYLNGASVAELCDGPIAEALQHLGAHWHRHEQGIYLEHVATSLCIEVLNQIRLLIPQPGPEAPVALGGAPEADLFIVPSLMAATVLADLGYGIVNLGAHTPVETMLQAVDQHRPRLVWLALTAELAPKDAADLQHGLLPALAARSVEVLLGGHGAAGLRPPLPGRASVLDSMQALSDRASALLAAG